MIKLSFIKKQEVEWTFPKKCIFFIELIAFKLNLLKKVCFKKNNNY